MELSFRDFIVDYTGKKHNPENDEVTLEMIIDTLSEEFPEVTFQVYPKKTGLEDISKH